MKCPDPECTGNHHAYPNLCPRSKREDSARKKTDAYKDQARAQKHMKYENLDGFAYAHLLLQHRRAKALRRIGLRGGLPSPATGRRTKQT